MELKEDLYDMWRRLIAVKGTKVTVISDHYNVFIVQDAKGNRFSINKIKLIFS